MTEPIITQVFHNFWKDNALYYLSSMNRNILLCKRYCVSYKYRKLLLLLLLLLLLYFYAYKYYLHYCSTFYFGILYLL